MVTEDFIGGPSSIDGSEFIRLFDSVMEIDFISDLCEFTLPIDEIVDDDDQIVIEGFGDDKLIINKSWTYIYDEGEDSIYITTPDHQEYGIALKYN